MAEQLIVSTALNKPLAYRIAGVARALNCTEHAARRMIEKGVIPSRRLGRRVIVLADELEAFLKRLPQVGHEFEPSDLGTGDHDAP